MKSSRKGTVIIEVVVLLAVVGGLWMSKDIFFSDRKKNAKASIEATRELVETQEKQSSYVAASLVSIGTANEKAPESPSRAFIKREVPSTLVLLPEPDKSALKAAETRRMAVMEGRLQEANSLYAEIKDQNAELVNQRNAAIAARRKADEVIMQAAKDAASAQLQRAILFAVAGVLAFGWFTRARQSVPLAVLGGMVGAAKRPAVLVSEIDSHLSPSQQRVVKRHARLNTEENDW